MSTISEYLLEGIEETGRRLGGGGFASVFLAKWRSCNVAIKRLHPAFMGLDSKNLPTKEFVDFMAEFRTLRKLAHPSIAHVFGIVKPSTPAESYGVVMEVLAMSLKERYAKMPPLTVGDEIRIVVCVSSAVEYLHDQGILHRDITTSNVMVTDTESSPSARGTRSFAKIVDLGVARILDDAKLQELSLSLTPGANRYMAPETLEETSKGKARYGKPADVFSVGVTVMSMLNKREPPSMWILANHGRAADLDSIDKSHPLCGVVNQCVSVKPEARPTASELCATAVGIHERHSASTAVSNASLAAVSDRGVASDTEELAVLREELRRVTIECENAIVQQDRVSAECELIRTEAKAERERLIAERDNAIAERELIRAEARAERGCLIAERDNAIAERNVTVAERDRISADLDGFHNEAAMERESLLADAHQRHYQQATASDELMRVHWKLAAERQSRMCIDPSLRKVMEDSQISSPRGFFIKDTGTKARCQRVFAEDGVIPHMDQIPKWEVKRSSWPSDVKRIVSIPCFNDGYMYQGFEESADEVHLALCRIKVSDIGKETWQPVRLPEGDWFASCRLFSFSGSLYCVVRRPTSSTPRQIYSCDSSGHWRLVTAFPCVVYQHVCIVVGSLFLVVGGCITPDGSPPYLRSVHAVDLCDPDTHWTRLPDLPYGCRTARAVMVGPYVHVMGFVSENEADRRKVLSINLAVPVHERHWCDDVLPPVPQYCSCPVVLNDCVVVVGGGDCNQWCRDVYMYVAECSKYLELPSLNVAKRLPLAVSHRNQLFVTSCESKTSDQDIEVLSA